MAQRNYESLKLGTSIGDHDQNKPFMIESSWFTRGAVIVGVPGWVNPMISLS